MKISELKVGASNVSIRAKVAQKGEVREVVSKYGKKLSVSNIVLQDDSGSITMSVWGNDINTISEGDTIEVTNGYVSEFRGTPQLSTGKFGKITVVEHGNSADAQSDEDTQDMDSSDSEDLDSLDSNDSDEDLPAE
ncbi:MAG: OB-fold nucleic acid binding domain-containing protein [Candidatus Micrarchaeia archaeon]